MRVIPLLGGLMATVLSAAQAQDVVKIDPAHYKVEFENADVRVLRVRFGPHERAAMHSHPTRVVVFLTDLHLKFTDPNGKADEIEGEAGHAGWGKAVVHTTENVSDTAGELIEVELKGKH
jgi:quercetin dioxygenase-like cupin family protein